MYKYSATDSIFDGVSNIYLISIATAFLAAIISFYCCNFLKDERGKELKPVLNDVDENEGQEEDNYLIDTKQKNQVKQGLKYRLKPNELEGTIDCENNLSNKNGLGRSNSSTNESSGIDDDTDEIHVDGLVGKLKSKRVKYLEAQLTRDQLEEEKRIEREQLAAIFELLKKQEEELNMKEIDESELNAQLALYR